MKDFNYARYNQNYAACVALYDMINSGELCPDELSDYAVIDEYMNEFPSAKTKSEVCDNILRKAPRNILWFG